MLMQERFVIVSSHAKYIRLQISRKDTDTPTLIASFSNSYCSIAVPTQGGSRKPVLVMALIAIMWPAVGGSHLQHISTCAQPQLQTIILSTYGTRRNDTLSLLYARMVASVEINIPIKGNNKLQWQPQHRHYSPLISKYPRLILLI